MRIKILMLSDDPVASMVDGRILKDRGLIVHTYFNTSNTNSVIDEIKPDLIFINPHVSNADIANVYNSLLSNMALTGTPIVYTLSEDDVYLVNRKRTSAKDKRNFICDNILDAVKVALQRNAPTTKSACVQKKLDFNLSKSYNTHFIN